MQVGEQALNVGRNAVLAAGYPESVPATTIDRQCGSSQQAIHFAAQGVMAGAYDVVIAAGVEQMTHTPMGSSVVRDLGFPFGPQVMNRYAERGGLVSQGVSAEMIADQWELSRHDLDSFGARSQQYAARATAEGRFEREIVPVKVRDDEGQETDEVMSNDEGVRPDTTAEVLANLKPAFKPDGKITAGNSSQITDGAAAVLIMSEEKAASLGLTPRARFHTFALAGVDPVTMLTGPIPATRSVLEKAKKIEMLEASGKRSFAGGEQLRGLKSMLRAVQERPHMRGDFGGISAAVNVIVASRAEGLELALLGAVAEGDHGNLRCFCIRLQKRNHFIRSH